jgi:hypothetical protein
MGTRNQDGAAGRHWQAFFLEPAFHLGRTDTGAANRIRTCDPVITNDVLYQLSYCGGPLAAFGYGAENARI